MLFQSQLFQIQIVGGQKNLCAALAENEIPGTIYGLSLKGWINKDLLINGLITICAMHLPTDF